MENLNALADIANTKAADAAKSPMPPPPATPGTSGKKRKRSAAAISRDKLVTSKKCQTYKLWEVLQRTRVIKDRTSRRLLLGPTRPRASHAHAEAGNRGSRMLQSPPSGLSAVVAPSILTQTYTSIQIKHHILH